MKRKLFAVIGLTIIFTLVFNLMTVNLPSNSASAAQILISKIETNQSSPNKPINLGDSSDKEEGVNSSKETKRMPRSDGSVVICGGIECSLSQNDCPLDPINPCIQGECQYRCQK